MQAVSGDSGTGSTKKFITPGRAISADDVDLTIRPTYGNSQVVQQIEQALVEIMNLTRPMITQKPVEASDRGRNVSVASPVNDTESLTSMGVEKVEAVWLRSWRAP